ncbi:MAG TPA: tRNA (adenosine(37)-N6)-dimethylallyltransferase MiaA [Smithella sp.]|nr:tRNA (adenosine(37)-N6)-dimethylallyltransferase MiaA [Smithella sp.]
MTNKLIVILGPTASGKTQLAARLAHDLQGEIISADSRQVYKNMDIGTGKDLNQYIIEGRQIPYHLIDVAGPEDEFNLFEFQSRFYKIFSDLTKRKILPILAGGTGLYLESVLRGYELPHAPLDDAFRENLRRKSKAELQKILLDLKPRLHNRTDLEDSERLIRAIEIEQARTSKNRAARENPPIDAHVFGIRCERSVLRQRIAARLSERLQNKMVEEVVSLHAAGVGYERLESFGLEYRFIARYLQGKITFDEMKNRLYTAICQFAKRQETWFRRMERNGIEIHWLGIDDYPILKESVINFLR